MPLVEMNKSQQIILLHNLIMEDMNFWNEDVFEDSSPEKVLNE